MGLIPIEPEINLSRKDQEEIETHQLTTNRRPTAKDNETLAPTEKALKTMPEDDDTPMYRMKLHQVLVYLCITAATQKIKT